MKLASCLIFASQERVSVFAFFPHMLTYAFIYETDVICIVLHCTYFAFIIVSPKVKLVDTVLMAARDLRICRAVFMLYLSIFSI